MSRRARRLFESFRNSFDYSKPAGFRFTPELQPLEGRDVPSAPAAPPGYTATATSFTNTTPVAISATGTPTVTSTITVSGVGSYLHDVDLTTFITHTFNSDLDITLTSPAGTIVTISSDNGSTVANVFNGTLWDDDADPGNPAPFSANTFAASNLATDTTYAANVLKTTLTPEEALGAFRGENPNGVWTITISDDANGDGGSLASWKLDLSTLNANAGLTGPQVVTNSTPVAISATGTPTVTSTLTVSGAPTYLQKLTLQTFITHTFNSDLDITLTSPAGTIVTISSDNGSTVANVFNGTLWDDDADPGNPAPFSANTFAASNLATDTTYAANVLKTTLTPEEPLAAFIGENPNGVWTITISDDANGDGGSLDSWKLNIFGAAAVGTPSAAATSPNVTSGGGTTQTVTVTYTDDTSIDFSTIGDGDITVTGPGGTITPTFVSATPNSGATITATYSFTPPGGSWDGSDNGTYTINVVANQVGDGTQFVPAGQIGSFGVTIPLNLVVTNLNDSGAGSLRQAILDTNASPTVDTIAFQAGLTGTINVGSLMTISGALTIVGNSGITLNAGGASQIFRIDGAGNLPVSISNLTLTGGSASGASAATNGGAISVADEILTLDRVVIDSNASAGAGGGIAFSTAGFLNLLNSTISGNTAAFTGGGIYFFSGGSFNIINSTISGNTTQNSGTGAYPYGGGGIYFFGTATAAPPAGFTANTLSIVNSTISGNTATLTGGGILLASFGAASNLLLQNTTVTGNTAATGGGIARTTSAGVISNTGVVKLQNTVVAQNTATTAGPDISTNTTAASLTAENSFIGNQTGLSITGTALSGNAMLDVLANNGGPTRTHATLPGSPLRDAGSNTLVPAGVTNDQRGSGFARVSGSAVDIGAIEFLAVTAAPTVTSPSAPVSVSATTFTITGTATANALVRVYQDVNNNGTIDAGDTVVASQQLTGGATSFSIATPLTANAANNFLVTAAAGNESAPTDVPTITQDAIAPTAPTVASPSAPVSVISSTFAITGTVEANALVRVYRDVNNNGTIDAGDTVVASQQLTGGATSFSIATPLTLNAVNDFLVTATDAVGNESAPTDVPTITQDAIAPTAPVVTSPSAPVFVNTTTFAIMGTAEANALVRVYRDVNNSGTIDAGDTVVASQQLTGGATVFSISTPLTLNAVNDFLVTAVDAAGNESVPTDVPTITQDAIAPTAPTVTSPSAPVSVLSSTFAITGTVEANALVRVYRDVNNSGTIDAGDTVVASQQLTGGATVFSISTPLTLNAVNDFLVTAVDAAGNESAPTDVPSITQDAIAPTAPTVTDPSAPVTVEGSSFAITGTAEANALVRVYRDVNNSGTIDAGDTVVAFQQLTGGATAFSIAAALNSFADNDFLVTAVDAAGNESAPTDVPTITQNSPNKAPAGTDKTVTTAEDTPLTFSVADFGFSDPDGNDLLAVVIASLPDPGAGTLLLNGTAVSANQIVSRTDIEAGLLTFAPAADANGSPFASFTFQVQDNGGTLFGGIDLDPTPNTIQINVTPVNDAPTLDDPADVPAAAIGALQTVNLTGISAGGGESQVLTVTATSDNPAVIATPVSVTYTSPDATGSLAFTPLSGGTAVITVTVSDGITSTTQTFTVTVNKLPVNTVPASATTLEDAPFAFTGASLISVADPDNTPGDLSTTVSVTGGTLAAAGQNGASLTFTGSAATINAALAGLVFTPAADVNSAGLGGPVVLTVSTTDAQGATGTDTVNIAVTAVNDAPAVTFASPSVSAPQNSPFTRTGFAVLNPGGADEAGQAAISYAVSVTNGALFSVPPTIDASGTLRFTPAPGATGTSVVTVIVRDNGGTANGGLDTSPSATFTITVTKPAPVKAPAPQPALTAAAGAQFVAIGSDVGASGRTQLLSASTGAVVRISYPFGLYFGGVRVAVGDVTGDGVEDLVAATATGVGIVTVYNGATGALVSTSTPFGLLPNGLQVATGDVDGDGRSDIVVAPNSGVGLVLAISGLTGQVIRALPVAPGMQLAVGDVVGNRSADIVLGLNGLIAVIDGQTSTLAAAFNTFPGSAPLAVGDVSGDGKADVVTALQLPGFGTIAEVFDVRTGSVRFFIPSVPVGFGTPQALGALDVTGDRVADVLVSSSSGGFTRVTALDGTTGAIVRDQVMLDPLFGLGGPAVG